MVHAETSTGVCNAVEEIGQLVQENGSIYLVDCVTSLGGMKVQMDDWHIDALYSGTQKCLSCPPGLSPVSFSNKAVEKLSNRTTKQWQKIDSSHHLHPFTDFKDLIKIVDFGLATSVENICVFKHCGTPGYVAPEIL